MLRTSLGFAAIGIISSLCACAEHFSSAYATVPVQTITARQGKYEILDRPELGRLAITPIDERGDKVTLAQSSGSPGSAFFAPLMDYFARTGRACRLIRGHPLVIPQWEFVYSCSASFDPSVITWQSSGFSSAPQPPWR